MIRGAYLLNKQSLPTKSKNATLIRFNNSHASAREVYLRFIHTLVEQTERFLNSLSSRHFKFQSTKGSTLVLSASVSAMLILKQKIIALVWR